MGSEGTNPEQKILVAADDEDILVRTLGRLARKAGFEFQGAESPPEAIALLESLREKIREGLVKVITDTNFKGKGQGENGNDIVERALELGVPPEYIGFASGGDQRLRQEFPGVTMMDKPFDSIALMEWLKR